MSLKEWSENPVSDLRLQLGRDYRDLRKYKYQLVLDHTNPNCSIYGYHFATQYIELSEKGRLTVFAGYAWDGATGAIDTPTFLRGSLIHDALYQCLRLGRIPPECRIIADQELRRICIEDGMCRVRAWWVYRAVRFGGRRAARHTPGSVGTDLEGDTKNG